MNHRSVLYFALSLFAIIVLSCNDDDPELPVIEIDTLKQIVFSPYADMDTIIIKSNCAWSINSNRDWCILSKESGAGNDTIFISVEPNRQPASRSAVITIQSEIASIKQVINATQTASSISISTSSQDVDGNEQNIEIRVTSSENYYIDKVGMANWISDINDFDGFVIIGIDTNETDEERSAQVAFVHTDNTAIADTLTINQIGLLQRLITTSKYFELTDEENEIDIGVSTMLDCNVNLPSWINVLSRPTLDNRFFNLVVEDNAGEDRTGNIIISFSHINLSDTVVVFQSGRNEETE